MCGVGVLASNGFLSWLNVEISPIAKGQNLYKTQKNPYTYGLQFSFSSNKFSGAMLDVSKGTQV